MKIANAVCDAVICLHEKTGMWYTDLKPENIFFKGEGDDERIMLGDLGSLCRHGHACTRTYHDPKHPKNYKSSNERYAVVGIAYVVLDMLYGPEIVDEYREDNAVYSNLVRLIGRVPVEEQAESIPEPAKLLPVKILTQESFADAAMEITVAAIDDN